MTQHGAHQEVVLALNAAEGRLQVALAAVLPLAGAEESASWRMLYAGCWHAPSQGAELLAPALRAACTGLKLPLTSLARIACVTGPGSFTGIRLCLATAAGLARVHGALQAPLPYLELLARGAFRQAACTEITGTALPALVWVVTHARNKLVHMQGFHRGPHAPRPCTEILVLSPDAAVERIVREKEPASLVGTGLRRDPAGWASLFAAAGYSPCILPAFLDAPAPDLLLEAAASAAYGPEDLVPLYVRPCDAEENLERIAAGLGLAPETARQALATATTGTPGLPEPHSPV